MKQVFVFYYESDFTVFYCNSNNSNWFPLVKGDLSGLPWKLLENFRKNGAILTSKAYFEVGNVLQPNIYQ